MYVKYEWILDTFLARENDFILFYTRTSNRAIQHLFYLLYIFQYGLIPTKYFLYKYIFKPHNILIFTIKINQTKYEYGVTIFFIINYYT